MLPIDMQQRLDAIESLDKSTLMRRCVRPRTMRHATECYGVFGETQTVAVMMRDRLVDVLLGELRDVAFHVLIIALSVFFEIAV